MKSKLLNSTAVHRINHAFDPGTVTYMPAARPGTVNVSMVQQLMNAAKAAGKEQGETTVDMGCRAEDMEKMVPYWDLTDDITTGYDAVKARGSVYLPKFPDEPQANYDNRKELGKFTNVYRDIVESLAAKPFEEEITLIKNDKVVVPPEIDAFVEDVDGAGNNISSFAGTTFFNGINSAIDWILIDYPKIDKEIIKTVEDLKKNNIKPFWSHIIARNMLEAKTALVNGNEELVRVRILEPGSPRHVRLFEKDPLGEVTFGLFQEVDDQITGKKKWVIVDSGPISIGVIPCVPFATGRRDGRTFFFYPAMRDAADLQIQLYRQESGLNFAKVMTAYPMLAANGIQPEMEADGKTPKKLAVGPNRVLYSKPDGSGNVGNWAYVEPSAQSLKFLADDVKETMQQLRELGRLPLTAQSGNLTVITTAYAANKSKSAVGAWGLKLKDALENALVITAKWLNTTPDYKPQVNVYDEFDDFTDQGADLSTLVSMRAAHDLSQETYWKEMKRRVVLAPEFDAEAEKQLLLDETPSDDDLNAQDDGAPGNPQPKKPAKK